MQCEQRFSDKPTVINDHAVATTRLLAMGSKLYPSKMPRMLNKNLTPSTQNNSGSEALLPGCRPKSVHEQRER